MREANREKRVSKSGRIAGLGSVESGDSWYLDVFTYGIRREVCVLKVKVKQVPGYLKYKGLGGIDKYQM